MSLDGPVLESGDEPLSVLYFGTYERDYSRNAQVVSCLRGAGVQVTEWHEPVWDGRRDAWRAGPRDALRLAAGEVRLVAQAIYRRRHQPLERFDAVIVGYPGHFDLPAARWAARGAPVVFNALVSLADTFVDDRSRFRPGSLAARALWRIDQWALNGADLVVADTEADSRFLAGVGDLEPRRVATCLVGAEERVFTPGWAPSEPFTVLFVGKLIPLHGLETILAAARLLPEIPFRIVGSGQLDDMLLDPPPNVVRARWVDYEQLPGEFHRAGCALGIFGTSAKAGRVIPNKVFQALACGTPLITADTEAARELLTDGCSALLVPAANPEALARAIASLAGDPAQAWALSEGGRKVYEEQASEAVLGRRWRDLVRRVAMVSP